MLLQNQKYFFASKVLMDLKTDCHSVHHAFSACSFGLQYETEVFMPLQLINYSSILSWVYRMSRRRTGQ